MIEKENYVEKFKLRQKVKYIGDLDLAGFMHKKKNIFTIDEVINYNDVKGYFPQTLSLKDTPYEDKGECRYLIGGRWSITESELESIK